MDDGAKAGGIGGKVAVAWSQLRLHPTPHMAQAQKRDYASDFNPTRRPFAMPHLCH